MDHTAVWPWCWEEEIAWRADLEERDDDFLQERLDDAVEEIAAASFYNPATLPEETLEGAASQEDLVTS